MGKRLFTYTSLLLLIASCANKKNISNNNDSTPKGEVLITTYCNSEEYLSTKEHFRATGIGESMDQMAARKKARSNAQTELAKTMSSTMKVVGDNYVKSSELNNKEELTETFQEMSRTIVNQELKGSKKICEKFTKTAEGNYKCYLALELSGLEVLAKYNEELQNNKYLKADYNYEKFKETFNEEMNKLENQQSPVE